MQLYQTQPKEHAVVPNPTQEHAAVPNPTQEHGIVLQHLLLICKLMVSPLYWPDNKHFVNLPYFSLKYRGDKFKLSLLHFQIRNRFREYCYFIVVYCTVPVYTMRRQRQL
jgi:hypothetical protein